MFLLPIGHEQDSTRRLPWVTFGTMIACALAFVLTGFGGSRSESAAIDAYQKAAEYWFEHPYLRLDPQVERTMHGMSTTGLEREAFREGMRLNSTKPDDDTLRAEQQQLDRLCELALNQPAESPFFRFGLVPADFSLVALVTHMFLHAGWLHLLGNMFILYLTGPFIEDVWGRAVYAGFYVVSGIVAALAFALPHMDLREPLVGASGAIAGVMGAFAVRYAATRIQFFYVIGLGMMRGTFWAPAWLMLGLWFAQQVLLSLLTAGGASEVGGKVAYLAHAAGFVFGAGVAFGFKRYGVEERHLAPRVEAASSTVVVQHAELDRAFALEAAGDLEGAWSALAAELARAPANHDAVLALWSLAERLDRSAQAAPHLARMIEDELRRGQSELAREHWDELRERVPTAMLDLRALVKLGRDYQTAGQREACRDALRRALLVLAKAPDPAIAGKVAELASKVDPAIASAAARIAQAAGRARV